MESITPPSLKAGDTIAIIPTARAITIEELRDGIALAESWGLRVKLGAGIGRKHFQQAGSDAERAADLQAAITDPTIAAIWCARGGYGTMRLMEGIDLAPLRQNPKWLIGFSDITVLHNALLNVGVCSLHAQMPHNIGTKTAETKETLRKALFAENFEIVSSGALLDAQRLGDCEGILIGGNLSLLYALRGTPYDIDPRGKILFIEDLDELLYHLDRMAMNLKLSGWFKNLAGLIVGHMIQMHDRNDTPEQKDSNPFGKTAEEIIADAIGAVSYPVCFNFPAGHDTDNRAIIMGTNAKLSVTANGTTLSFGRDPQET